MATPAVVPMMEGLASTAAVKVSTPSHTRALPPPPPVRPASWPACTTRAMVSDGASTRRRRVVGAVVSRPAEVRAAVMEGTAARDRMVAVRSMVPPMAASVSAKAACAASAASESLATTAYTDGAVALTAMAPLRVSCGCSAPSTCASVRPCVTSEGTTRRK